MLLRRLALAMGRLSVVACALIAVVGAIAFWRWWNHRGLDSDPGRASIAPMHQLDSRARNSHREDEHAMQSQQPVNETPMPQSPVATTARFVDAINAHDVAAICELITADHVFVDSLGNKQQSRNAMRDAWEAYFKLFPDYAIHVEHVVADGDRVVVLGRAEGTYAEDAHTDRNHWEVPAAWHAEVRSQQIRHWQVYTDSTPVLEIMQTAGSD